MHPLSFLPLHFLFCFYSHLRNPEIFCSSKTHLLHPANSIITHTFCAYDRFPFFINDMLLWTRLCCTHSLENSWLIEQLSWHQLIRVVVGFSSPQSWSLTGRKTVYTLCVNVCMHTLNVLSGKLQSPKYDVSEAKSSVQRFPQSRHLWLWRPRGLLFFSSA